MRWSETLFWSTLSVIGAVLVAVAYPRVMPLLPWGTQVMPEQAIALASETLAELGEITKPSALGAYVDVNPRLERYFAEGRSEGEVIPEWLQGEVVSWVVSTGGGPPGSGPPGSSNQNHWVQVGFDGRILGFQLAVESEEGLPSEREARQRAEQAFEQFGFDRIPVGSPTFERRESPRGSELELRFPWRQSEDQSAAPDGEIKAIFVGNRLTGMNFSLPTGAPRQIRYADFIAGLRWLLTVFLGVFLAVRYQRFYDSGEVRYRRALQIALVVGAAGFARFSDFFSSLWMSSSSTLQQLWTTTLFVGFIALVAIFGFLAWGMGESLVRGYWPAKLASFEALLRGRWANATVAASTFRGTAAGIATAGFTLAICLLLRPFHVTVSAADVVGSVSMMTPSLFTSIPGLVVIGDYFFLTFPVLLACLSVPTVGIAKRFGRAGPAAVLLLICLLVRPPLLAMPLLGTLVVWLLVSALPVWLFLRWDLLCALLGHLSLFMFLRLYPLLMVDDLSQHLGALLLVTAALLPMLISAPFLRSTRQVTYEFDTERDIPTQVLRRIADRARHRVELETARGIQASILPNLPPHLGGLEVAHAYLPSSEVGGDFYDAIEVDGGRIAVALGDVAGHGVSSGLIMAMVRGALAVQVDFDPRPRSVCTALNRLVHKAAGRRYLTTFWYGLLDPAQNRLTWAAAGHSSFLVRSQGSIEMLSSSSYPLGVRAGLEIEAHDQEFLPGDTLLLCSDGLVEAASPDGELFGFDRLQAALERFSGSPAETLCEGLLKLIDDFAGSHAEDDRTLLVIRRPTD